ncbi:MAG: hypothetical protein ABFS46_01720 [Myxococcota bacterium]
MNRIGSCISVLRPRGIEAMLLMGALLPLLWGASAAAEAPVLRMLHVVETHEVLGVPDEAGLAFPPGANSLLTLEESSLAGRLQRLAEPDAAEETLSSTRLSDAINLALDADRRVLLLDAATHELTVLSGPEDAERFDLSRLGLGDPRGTSVDPASGRLYILDGDRRIVVIDPDRQRSYRAVSALRQDRVSELPLSGGWVDLRGLAFDSETGHLHVYSPETRELFELDGSGRVEDVRRLPEGEGNPRAMIFAPSRDGTDPPERTSLYLAGDGRRPPQTTEWTLHAAPIPPDVVTESPLLVPSSELSTGTFAATAVAPAASGDPTLIRTIEAWRFNPPSPDSAGIAYLPGSNSLLMSDSEVNEMSIYQGVNMFELTPSGSLFDTWDTTAFSKEPTGVAYNPGNGHAYLSDDSADRVWEVDPRSGGVFGDGNDVVTSLDTKRFGSGDPEGVAYNPTNGFLYIVDGVNREVYEVNPGSDGKFNGQGDVVRNFDTLGIGISDPEGITADPGTGNLYIAGKPNSEVREVTTSGTLVRVLDVSAANPDKSAGLAYGPTSIDSSQASLYLAARGVDNGKDPSENDGEIYEFSLGDFNPGPSNDPPTVVAPSDATVGVGQSISLHATVSDDGLPDPPGSITSTTWTQDSGPAQAQIDNPSVEDTTVSFPAIGSYALRVTAFDGQLSGSDVVIFTVIGANGEVPVEVRVVAGSDDAEEMSSGRVKTGSRDLELTLDKLQNQTVGLRFRSVDIPQLASIENAWIQFQADEIHSEPTSLTIAAEASGDAATFLAADGNLSGRSTTSATVGWSPPPWEVAGEVGPAERTGDISAVVQQVVDRGDWSAGNDLVILITGSGKRVAEAYEGSFQDAPLLHVEYSLGGGPHNRAPTVEVGADQTLEFGESTGVSGSVSDDGLPDPPGAIQSTTWSQLNGPPFASIGNPSSLSTGVTFPSDGTYWLRLSAFDGDRTGTDALTVTVNPPPPGPGQNSTEVRIAASADDAEERGDLSMKLTSGDLEMTLEKGAFQTVGMRFHPLEIPPGAHIDSAWIRFQVDEATSVQTDLRIEAEASDDAPAFVDVDGGLSLRPTTGSFVDWPVPAWPVKGASGAEQQTPDLASVIDSVVNGGGWQSGNALVILITGSGERVAESFDGDAAGAPLLQVEFTLD